MKVSVCITVFNEEESISGLLDSLLAQTKKAYEIVIVDGGSNDKTKQLIKKYQRKSKKIKLFAEEGSIAHGRNVSIKKARGSVVALSDGGCTPKKNWLEKITKPFEDRKVGLVAGFYKMPTRTSFQKAASVYLGVPPSRFDPNNFLPSARSVAFRKKIWEEVGGFDENLTKAGEDTKFFYSVVKRGFKILRVKDALVSWNEIGEIGIKSTMKKFYVYAMGDAEAGIWWHPSKRVSSHNIKIISIYARYFAGLLMVLLTLAGFFAAWFLYILILFYLIYPIWKFRNEIKGIRARFWLPVVQITSDIAVMAGFAAGTIRL